MTVTPATQSWRLLRSCFRPRSLVTGKADFRPALAKRFREAMAGLKTHHAASYHRAFSSQRRALWTPRQTVKMGPRTPRRCSGIVPEATLVSARPPRKRRGRTRLADVGVLRRGKRRASGTLVLAAEADPARAGTLGGFAERPNVGDLSSHSLA
jgi:hypothetical protein